jgi:glycosyltransferase involved in cell wall biosynthesis
MEIVHFYNANGGGVLSVIKTLSLYSRNSNLSTHVILIVDSSKFKNYQPPKIQGAKSVKIFYFSPNSNFYYISIELKKLIPSDNALLVAHDWIELGMISTLGINNSVIQFLHSDSIYYYDLAQQYSNWVDKFICVSNRIKRKLTDIMPSRAKDIVHFNLPVIEVIKNRTNSDLVRIAFAGRAEFAKGYHLLPLIDNCLKEKKLKFKWNLVGAGTDNLIYNHFQQSDVKCFGNVSQEELIEVFNNSDVLVLPSFIEGTPLVVVEAMKCGVVPIVNDLPGGLQEIIYDNFNGFKINKNLPNVFANRIELISKNLKLFNSLSYNATCFSNFKFNPWINTKKIEDYFIKNANQNKIKLARKVVGSRLDSIYIPNELTKLLRRFTK